MFNSADAQAVERVMQREEENFLRFCSRYERLLAAAKNKGYERDEASRLVEIWFSLDSRSGN